MFKNNLVLTILFVFSTSFISTDYNKTFDNTYIDLEYIVSADKNIEIPDYDFYSPNALEDAKELIGLCEKGVIEKNRYYHKLGKHVFEVDEFLGNNEGLLIAEIELENKNEIFLKPDYLGIEVTGVEKYYNSSLNKNPFKNWV